MWLAVNVSLAEDSVKSCTTYLSSANLKSPFETSVQPAFV